MGALAAGMPAVVIGAVLGLLVSTAAAMRIGVEGTALHSGLYGFNGVLVGVALPTFLQPSPFVWLYVILGALVSTGPTSRRCS
jgi:urea transporter